MFINQQNSFMNNLKRRLTTLQNGYHFIGYCITFIGLACIISGLGPLIPYLAYYSGNSIESYSFFFIIRAVGFIIGAVSMNKIQKYYNFHQILAISTVFIFVSLTLFSLFLNQKIQGIFLIFISIVLNVCIIKSQFNGDVQIWLLVAHSTFGIGGLVGPYLVYLFQVYSFMTFGIILMFAVPFFYYLKSPQVSVSQHLQTLSQYSKSIQEPHILEQKKDPLISQAQNKRRDLPIQIQHAISFLAFLYLAMECTFSNWLPSYSVLQKVSTKQEATQYGSYFWASMALFRLVVLFIRYDTLRKLQLLVTSLAIFIFISLFLIFADYTSFACTFSSWMFGISLSSVYSLLFSTPSFLKFQPSSTQAANFVFWASIGQGVAPTIIGYLMVNLSHNCLYYSMLFMAVVFFIQLQILKSRIRKDKQEQINQETIQSNTNKKLQQLKQLNSLKL